MAIDKKKTKFRIKRLSQIKTWQLVILLIMSGFISATFLRLNNVGMVERRESVENADKAGDIVNLQQRLYDLQHYAGQRQRSSCGQSLCGRSQSKNVPFCRTYVCRIK